MSKETTTIPTEEYINLCSFRRIIEVKENVYQRIVDKEDGVTRCETMQVFAPEEYQQRVEEWCAVFNGGKELNANELRELYALREKSKRLEVQYIRKCDRCNEVLSYYREASKECIALKKEREGLKSKLKYYSSWKACAVTSLSFLCVLLYITVKSNL